MEQQRPRHKEKVKVTPCINALRGLRLAAISAVSSIAVRPIVISGLFATLIAHNAHADSFTPIPGETNWLRDVSADGTTAIGESATGPFRWRAQTGIEFLDIGADATVHDLSSNGDVIVGGLQTPARLPYRWSDEGLIVLEDSANGSGIALGVSADGTQVVGEFGQPPRPTETGCVFNCVVADDGSVHAFRWTQETGLIALVDSSTAATSKATAVSADGETIAINTLNYESDICVPTPNGECARIQTTRSPARIFSSQLDTLLTGLQLDDQFSDISSDGSTLIGVANNGVPFRWRSDSFFQSVLRPGRSHPFRRVSIARAVSGDGEVVGGDFGLWQFGRTVDLENLLINGLGLDVVGWNFDSFYVANSQLPFPAVPIFGDAGITGISDDGLTLVGTALDPSSMPRGFVVQLDEQLDRDRWASLPPMVNDALLTSVLPGARTMLVGDVVTVFASMANRSSEPLSGCYLTQQSGLPVSTEFWVYDAETNEFSGNGRTPFAIPAGETRTLLVSLRANAPFNNLSTELRYDCGNTNPARVSHLLNTLALNASDTQLPDIIVSAVSGAAPGYVLLDEDNNGAYAIAATNLGASESNMRIRAASLGRGINTTVCETEPATGECIVPATTNELEIDFASNSSRTFAIFLNSDREVRPEPGFTRSLALFYAPDSAEENILGLTSLAVASARFVATENPSAGAPDAR